MGKDASARTPTDKAIGVLEHHRSSVAKLLARLESQRKEIEWCHRLIVELYSPIGYPATAENFCKWVGMKPWGHPTRRYCNHTERRDHLCGNHWNTLFGHEWTFTGQRPAGMGKFNKSLRHPATCSLCGVSRSSATVNEPCTNKGEREWVKNELAVRRSKL